MATRIKLKRSTTAAAVPTTSNLEDGEVALNIADRKLYARNGSNIIEVANQKPNTGEVVTTMLSSDITNGQGNTYYVATVGSDSATLANGGNNGKHPDTPFLTVTAALGVATSGDTIIIAPGEYQEAFPMTVPDGVTVRGTNLRSTSIKPTGATNDNNAFIIAGDVHISDLTIKDFLYNSGADEGYAFVLASNVDAVKSPYIERVTVATKGSVTSGSDPYGYTQGDAGRGAKLDGAQYAAASQHCSVLFNECTFITPNQIGVKVTNGVRVEWLNCFNYFASIGIQGIQGATGKFGTGKTRLKLSGVSGTFSASEVAYQLEDSFQSGTYARSGTTVTLTRTGHGLSTNDYIYADFISGGATDNFYQVTKVDNNVVTLTDSSSGTIASGNVTYKKVVARGVLDSNDGTYVYINGKGTGEFVTTTKSAKATSRFGDTQIDTAQKKFGTASILLDGTEDALTVPTSEDFGFGTANFCIEAFIRPNSVTGIQHIFDLRDTSATDTAPKLYLNGTTLHFGVGNASVRSGGTLATGTWYHVAVARNGGTTKLFLDGTELGTGADTNDYGTTKPVRVGSNYAATPAEEFDGHIDEVRVSKGAARFTGAFTPTTSEYGSDLNTVLLLHSNDTDGTTTFTDSSGGISDVRSSGGDSATAVTTADYSQFGAEMRSVASACVYGQKGVQADGSGVKLILTAHNFGYVGAQSDYTNDPSLAVQANEVEELNSGKVLFSSTDQDGDFRVGDAFSVDQETGNVSFAATSTAQSAANITLSDGTGTTNIYPAYIETGNLRLAGNSITSTTGQVIVDPSGNEDFVVNAETIVKEAVYFDVNKSTAFGSTVQGVLNITGFNDSTLFGSSEASCFSTRSFVVFQNQIGTVNLASAGSGYFGGVHTVTVSSNPNTIATATATLATTGSLATVTLNAGARGSLYTAAPTVALSGSGGGTVTAALANGSKVAEIEILAGGTGYAGPTFTADAPPQQSFSASATTVDLVANTITINNHTFETGDQMTYDAQTLDASATAIGGLTHNSTYYAIFVDSNTIKVASSQGNANSGNELSLTGVGSLSQFFIGVTAVVTLTQTGGVIDGGSISNAGTGYGASISGTLADSGAGAGGNINLKPGFAVGTLSIGVSGSYTTATTPTVTITRDAADTTGSGAAATAVVGFPVESVSLDTQGLGYRNLPSIDVSAGGTTPASFNVTLDELTGRISTCTINSAGDGYTSAPTLTFVGGAGAAATLSVTVQSLTGSITSNGSGYTPGTYQNVGFTTTGAGISATATFLIPGFTGTITNGGSGYTDTALVNATLRNTPTATKTVTVVTRTKLNIDSTITNGPFQVGETVTGSVSNATGTVTATGTDISGNAYIFLSNVTGTFQDANTENAVGGTSTATSGIATIQTGAYRWVIDGVEAASFSLIDNNTYHFDTSDASNSNHNLLLGTATNVITRQSGTAGTAGSYWEVVVGAQSAVAGEGTTDYRCVQHGADMGLGGTITFTTGAAGQSGEGMTVDLTISGGVVTAATIVNQGTGGNFAVGHTFFVDADDAGGTGSGFLYTLSGAQTGITTVSNISAIGSGYQVGDVLSVADTDVGGGGGSGFQFTVASVGVPTAVTVSDGGYGFEANDTLILGEVAVGETQGTGLNITIATLNQTKSIELGQDGRLTLGPTGSNTIVSPDGQISSSNWNISASGNGAFYALSSQTSLASTTTLSVGSTSTFTGLGTFNAGINVDGADSDIKRTKIQITDGSAAEPSLSLFNSNTTGFYRLDADKIGISVAGVAKGSIGANGIDIHKFQVDATPDSLTPFFKIDSSTNKVQIGSAATNLEIDATNTITTGGTDISVPLNFDTKGEGNFVFKGGTNVDFSITDGTTETFKIDTENGDATFTGNLDAGLLRLVDNTVQNNSSTATRSFGQILALTVTGTGSGYTDGTYTATATTSNGAGTGCTVTVTVASGDFSAVTVVAKGQNYSVGDTLTITAAGGGSGRTVTVTDIDGSGVVLKPSAGADILCNTTGSFVVPSGTTNERPNALDRRPGAIRYNTTQLQFEGYNGTDFVSLGGVRDVDQDTYILTESAPGSDEDTFEFFAQGVNCLALDKDKLTFKTSKLFSVPGTLIIDGTDNSVDSIEFKRNGTSVAKIRTKKDFEVTNGLRLRAVPIQGAIDTIGSPTGSSGVYTASTTFTAVAGTSEFEGINATFDVVIDGSQNISSVAVNAAGTGFESLETITIAGNLLGGATPANDVTFTVTAITNTVPAFARLDVINQDFVSQLDNKPFISLDANAAQAQWKINRGWNGGTSNYLTVFDSTGDFVELDDCRVEGGELTSFSANASITAFDKTTYKGAKTLITIESNDGKVHMFEVTAICAAAGTAAHATITNSITSDNDLMDATVSVAGNNVNISLNKSSAATSSTTFTGRFTTTKVKV